MGVFPPSCVLFACRAFLGKSLIEFRSGVHEQDRGVPIGSEETRGLEEKPVKRREHGQKVVKV